MADNKMTPPPKEESFLSSLGGALKRTGSFGGSGEGPDIYKLALGKDSDELANEGRAAYPDTPIGSRHHQLAAKLAAQKYGFIPTQVLGLGVEGAEALMGGMKNPHWAEDTTNDLKANWRGGMEGVAEQAKPLLDRLRGLKQRLTPKVTYDDMVKAKGKFTKKGNYVAEPDSLGYRPLGMTHGVDLTDEETLSHKAGIRPTWIRSKE